MTNTITMTTIRVLLRQRCTIRTLLQHLIFLLLVARTIHCFLVSDQLVRFPNSLGCDLYTRGSGNLTSDQPTINHQGLFFLFRFTTRRLSSGLGAGLGPLLMLRWKLLICYSTADLASIYTFWSLLEYCDFIRLKILL